MCPVVLLSLLLSFLMLLVEAASAFKVTFHPNPVSFREGDSQMVNFTIVDGHWNDKADDSWKMFDLQIADEGIAKIEGNRSVSIRTDDPSGSFNVTGVFLGQTKLVLVDREGGGRENEKTSETSLDIIVKRKQSTISLIFTISVATLVSLNYINMGCALDLGVVGGVLRKPIAPALGFFSQYLVMPVTSYLIGLWLLKDWIHLRLGLFIFGCSPAGGASNMWTVLLSGNLDLSITMTFISTIAATGMLPIWMYTLGKQVYPETTTMVPVRNILTTLASMVVCLGIGLAFQRWLPRVAARCKRILAPVSVGMIIFIITFGTYANLYMFKLMNLRILMSAGLTVWIGFTAGYLLAVIFRLPSKDQIAICVETGIQNTGIAIVLLGLSLPAPSNDIAVVVPVAASIMTPIPLTFLWIAMKCYRRCIGKTDKKEEQSQSNGLSNSSSSTLLPHPEGPRQYTTVGTEDPHFA